ncbi:LysM domain-containing protein [Metarhizium album ARSEF 1941]|uniref:LysM domain-containing protein n=1 Tax=Metarhizium album (strain ARSEF 1941) TaxID=1081103 RepID=A0A0B2WXH6_METAS|nr:LysM domain-containing protein [Metarhizium album ARSEF 1941]KHO00987.1 LysM domain-containing protein [Metarhizium album ARSEF 1941]
MLQQSVGFASLLSLGLASVAQATEATKRGHLGQRPRMPYDPNTAANCTWWIDNDGSKKCEDMPEYSGIDMVDWLTRVLQNPSLTPDCGNFLAGRSYCVEARSVLPTATTSSTPAEPTNPSPTQAGIPTSCNKFYKAGRGDTCQGIVDRHGVELHDFYKWNPAITGDCVGLWQGYYYCVGVLPAFELRAFYHAGCTGKQHGRVTMASGSHGACFDTDCQVASFNVSAVGDCPHGQVQISYWEQPGCTGKWFGYGYTSRDTCRTLWTEGWKFKAVHLRCAREKDDCVSNKTCTYDPEPSRGICM